MKLDTKTLPKNEIELTFEIPVEEFRDELERAAAHLQEHKAIPGYRPGKAPYDIVKNSFGEMAIYEEALPDVVRHAYVEAVMKAGYRPYGDPRINVTKLAPGNSLAFTATITLVPEVKSLADFRKIKVAAKAVEVPEKDVDQALKDLRKMRTQEVRSTEPVKGGDKVVLDMDLSLDKVPLDGGQAKGHSIYLDEEYYVPGMKEQLLGLKEGDKKEFRLKFPDTHYQKNIAGKEVDFAVTIKEVYGLTHPELNDEFAKGFGQESLTKLRDLIRDNMKHEAEEKEAQRLEVEMLDKVVEKSSFGDISDRIINTEIERMIDELKGSVSERGISFDDYLKNIKKTLADLKLDFAAQAVKRVKTALAIRDIGEKEKLEVTDEELLAEVNRLMNQYKDSSETQERLRSDEYQDWLRSTMRNRKVIALLKKEILGEEHHHH